MNDDRDPWPGLTPMRPPVALRAHVLAAARHAATQPARGLLEALGRDRLLRACAAVLAALVIANAFITGGGGAAVVPRFADPAFAVPDDAAVPGDAGLTASEQLHDLAPVLGDAVARSRG
jgi:hypothetical protein